MSSYINEITKLSSSPKFAKSFEFIKMALSSWANNLLFIPAPEPTVANFELKLDKHLDPFSGEEDGVNITSLVSNNKELISKQLVDGAWGMNYFENLNVLKEKLSKLYVIPFDRITIASNIDKPENIHLEEGHILDIIR